MNQEFRQCECGAYRISVFVDGRWFWAAGCLACDRIERLEQLLEANVSIRYKKG